MVLNIRKRREALGLAQISCAALLGVSPSVLSQWESEVALPRTRDLPQLAKVLRCDYNGLFVEQPFDSCDPDGIYDQYTA